jgi:cytochrome c oxidase assembly protein subunit 15
MHSTTLAQMAITGLLVAMLPLAMVWVSSDENKYRKLVWICVFLTFDLIVFGGFTRLTDSGLGCPDWPGCYGLANPFLAHEEIRAAETLMPSGPVTLFKAWVEMIHRYLAMGIGVLIVAMMAAAWRLWFKARKAGKGAAAGFEPGMPTALFFFVCLQGAFGAWTVTLKLQPVIVTTHLLLGMGLLAMLAWFGCRQDRVHHALLAAQGGKGEPSSAAGLAPAAPLPVLRTIRWLALASGIALLIQLALGGWVSTNYATLACTEFPLCAGKAIPDMDFDHAFHLWRELGKTAAGHYLPFAALTAIHWVHRNFALVVVVLAGATAWRAWRVTGMASLARGLAIVLTLQAATGLATIYLNFPLAIAVLHNAGAALLVLLLTVLNYRAKHQFDTAQQGAAGSSRPAAAVAPARHHQ